MNHYEKPKIETLDIELEGTLCESGGNDAGFGDPTYPND